MSLRGYCRTLSERIDCSPAIRMTRLTTIASTGRRMKRSVSFISCPPASARARCGLDLVVDQDGGAVRSLKTPEVTTSSPGLRPESTATWSPRAAPSFTNCWRTPR